MNHPTGIHLAACAFALGLLGNASAQAPVAPSAHDTSAVAPEGINSRYLLQAHFGKAVTDQDFPGQFQLITFGYTFCPDVCPTTLVEVAHALELLGDRARRVQPLFVTIDPARDTLDVLKPYLEHFHPAFIGLGGSEQQIRAAADLFKVYYARDDATGASYGFTHSDRIYLIDRQGRVRATFANSTTDDEMLAAVRLLLAE